MDEDLSRGQNVLKTREGGLESPMADNRLIRGRDSDAHRRQGRRVEQRWRLRRGMREMSDKGEEDCWLIRVVGGE
jgi:hypothetical protein